MGPTLGAGGVVSQRAGCGLKVVAAAALANVGVDFPRADSLPGVVSSLSSGTMCQSGCESVHPGGVERVLVRDADAVDSNPLSCPRVSATSTESAGDRCGVSVMPVGTTTAECAREVKSWVLSVSALSSCSVSDAADCLRRVAGADLSCSGDVGRIEAMVAAVGSRFFVPHVNVSRLRAHFGEVRNFQALIVYFKCCRQELLGMLLPGVALGTK